MKSPLVSVVIPTKDREKNLTRLLASLHVSTYKNQEIIIVNNSVNDLSFKNTKTKIINNKSNRGLAYARSKGAEVAKGTYILFIDDDNIVDPSMIEKLVSTLDTHPEFIAVGPLTCYLQNKKKIWFASVTMNLFTTKPTFHRFVDKNSLIQNRYMSSDNLHNCFMVKKTDGESVGWFDKKIFMNGTEYDLFQKTKRNRPGILVTDTQALDYHDVPTYTSSLLRSLGFENELRVYYFQRNRGLLVKRYGTAIDQLSLFFVFYPIFFIFYSILFLIYGRLDFLKTHIRATKDGYVYLLKGSK